MSWWLSERGWPTKQAAHVKLFGGSPCWGGGRGARIGLAMGVKSCTRAHTLKRGSCACARPPGAGELLKEQRPFGGVYSPTLRQPNWSSPSLVSSSFFFFASLIWKQNKTLHFTSTYFGKQAAEMLKYHLVWFPTHCKMVAALSCSVRQWTVPNVNVGFLNSKRHGFHMGS